LGSYSLEGNALSGGSLLGIRGCVGEHDLLFMLDSGASVNFMSQALFATLGLSYSELAVFPVKLANGKFL
jgi:predicted aspartyl protease